MQLICANCNNPFQKDDREYKKQIKRGSGRFFCSLSCSAKKNNKENPPKGNSQFLISNNRKDEYTPFRWYILRAEFRNRKRNFGCDLTLEYLKQLWDFQNGTCPITGWKLILPNNTHKAWINENPCNASLDRIDSSKGYTQGNVRFISVMANYAKNIFTDKQLLEFCEAVVLNGK